MLKKILWALVPVIASRVLNSRRAGQQPRADKTRYNGRFGR
ncbi:hypothetical protein [Arthrobacter agilis]|jgi:hypothetical protein|nr:hypothetical protein [Arthrobacter agilis]MDQ0736344.1 hypothetical protein [Arthrobacter agilis]